MFISSERNEFAGYEVFIYTVLDPERRGRELIIYILNHQRDYDHFSVNRKRFMILMSSSKINMDDLIPMYYTRQFIKKAFSYSYRLLYIWIYRRGSDLLRFLLIY